jgi:hypothetical protein
MVVRDRKLKEAASRTRAGGFVVSDDQPMICGDSRERVKPAKAQVMVAQRWLRQHDVHTENKGLPGVSRRP